MSFSLCFARAKICNYFLLFIKVLLLIKIHKMLDHNNFVTKSSYTSFLRHVKRFVLDRGRIKREPTRFLRQSLTVRLSVLPAGGNYIGESGSLYKSYIFRRRQHFLEQLPVIRLIYSLTYLNARSAWRGLKGGRMTGWRRSDGSVAVGVPQRTDDDRVFNPSTVQHSIFDCRQLAAAVPMGRRCGNFTTRSFYERRAKTEPRAWQF